MFWGNSWWLGAVVAHLEHLCVKTEKHGWTWKLCITARCFTPTTHRQPLVTSFPCMCCIAWFGIDYLTCPDFEQAYLEFPLLHRFQDQNKAEFAMIHSTKSAGGDHTQRGCLLHSLTTGTRCHWRCRRRWAVYVTTDFGISVSKWALCPWKKGLNSEGTVQKRESRWMPWRAFQVPTNHVPRLLRGMQSIVSWSCAQVLDVQSGG